MIRWKLVSQKSVFRTKLFTVKAVNFVNKNGKNKIYYNVERAPAVSIFPLTDSYEIYLISQYRYMLESTVLEAVSGYIEKKETIIAAAKRELMEETGIVAHQWEELSRIEMAASVFSGRVNLLLAKNLYIGKKSLDDDEEISLVKMPLMQAVEKVMLGEINHAASVIGILLLDKLKREKKLFPSRI